MKPYYKGLDVLRGLGVFFVIVLHTAFYFYKDLYDVDINNPSLMITLIGFLLMFAGLFAMISGMSHTIQTVHHYKKTKNVRTKYMIISGMLMLLIAYMYFLFTGPGLVMFAERKMDESLIVSLINQKKFQNLSMERLLYVDSLVMIGLNIMLLGVLLHMIKKYILHKHLPHYLLFGATLFMVLSYIRIPLYDIYLEAKVQNNYMFIVIMNFFVNKNNPIFPFFAFALFGAWFALLLLNKPYHVVKKYVLSVGFVFILIGIIGYILTPETMLERSIDPTWYFIMVMQIGLFLCFILCAISTYDMKEKEEGSIIRFIKRFGVAGLTPFFFESIISALIFLLLNQVFVIALNIPLALLYGFCLAIFWGIFLKYWENKSYQYGIEWLYGKTLNRFGKSSKFEKLKSKKL